MDFPFTHPSMQLCFGRDELVATFEEHAHVKLARPYQLLIADDDAGFRDVLRAIFEPFFALIEAVSGEQAVEIVEHGQVDLLVLDMNMDRLTGLETIRIVKRMDARMPCILVTSDATEDLRRQAEAADAWSVLAKPVRKTDLLRTVSTAIGFRYDDPDVFSTLGLMN